MDDKKDNQTINRYPLPAHFLKRTNKSENEHLNKKAIGLNGGRFIIFDRIQPQSILLCNPEAKNSLQEIKFSLKNPHIVRISIDVLPDNKILVSFLAEHKTTKKKYPAQLSLFTWDFKEINHTVLIKDGNEIPLLQQIHLKLNENYYLSRTGNLDWCYHFVPVKKLHSLNTMNDQKATFPVPEALGLGVQPSGAYFSNKEFIISPLPNYLINVIENEIIILKFIEEPQEEKNSCHLKFFRKAKLLTKPAFDVYKKFKPFFPHIVKICEIDQDGCFAVCSKKQNSFTDSTVNYILEITYVHMGKYPKKIPFKTDNFYRITHMHCLPDCRTILITLSNSTNKKIFLIDIRTQEILIQDIKTNNHSFTPYEDYLAYIDHEQQEFVTQKIHPVYAFKNATHTSLPTAFTENIKPLEELILNYLIEPRDEKSIEKKAELKTLTL